MAVINQPAPQSGDGTLDVFLRKQRVRSIAEAMAMMSITNRRPGNDTLHRWLRIAGLPVLTIGPSGCAAGAPYLSLFGAYFPAWLACALFGVAVALAVRIALVATGTIGTIPMQLLVCVCAGICGGILLSWLWLGI
jgi:hypothetical protein